MKRVFSLNSSRFTRALCVAAAVLLSSYCTRPDNRTELNDLTDDEAYLVSAYVRIARARDRFSISYLESESLLTVLDSTIDTTRIANTIRLLNTDPDRWILIFRGIERDLSKSSQGQESEKTR